MRSGLKAAVPFLSHPRFEVIPTDSVEDAVVKWVPREVTVTVTTSPRKGLDATLGLTERLSKHGYRVVPHVSARLVVDEVHLEEIVARLTGCGVVDIFVPAGDTDPPVGSFESALSLLVKLDALGRPFPQMGITGYPESHPAISDDLTVQAMWDKRHYATYIVSNLCFDAATVRRWIRRGTGTRRRSAPVLRSRRASRAHQTVEHGEEDRSGRVCPLSFWACWLVPAHGGAWRLQPESPARSHRCCTGGSGLDRRGRPPVHLQSGPADRGMAPVRSRFTGFRDAALSPQLSNEGRERHAAWSLLFHDGGQSFGRAPSASGLTSLGHTRLGDRKLYPAEAPGR